MTLRWILSRRSGRSRAGGGGSGPARSIDRAVVNADLHPCGVVPPGRMDLAAFLRGHPPAPPILPMSAGLLQLGNPAGCAETVTARWQLARATASTASRYQQGHRPPTAHSPTTLGRLAFAVHGWQRVPPLPGDMLCARANSSQAVAVPEPSGAHGRAAATTAGAVCNWPAPDKRGSCRRAIHSQYWASLQRAATPVATPPDSHNCHSVGLCRRALYRRRLGSD